MEKMGSRKLRIFGFIACVVLSLAFASSAFAADNGSISIDNATEGHEYKLYKVLDATYSGNAVAYTIDESNSNLLMLLQGNKSPFDVAKNTLGSYNVQLKDGKGERDVVNFFNSVAGQLGDPVRSVLADGQNITWTGLAYGYYYVSSSLGAAFSLSSAVPAVSMIDKNQEPGAYVKYLYDPVDGQLKKECSINYGDIVRWNISAAVTNYMGDSKVVAYEIQDDMGTGFIWDSFQVSSITVIDPDGTQTLLSPDAYSIVENAVAKTRFIHIPWIDAGGDSLYHANATLSVECQAQADDSGEAYSNLATLLVSTERIAPTFMKVIPLDTETLCYTYDLLVDKFDKNDAAKKLAGAEFVLYKKIEDKPLYYKYENGCVTWVEDKATASIHSSDILGAASFMGVAAGIYYLEEVKAPEGYNQLSDPVEFEIVDADLSLSIGNVPTPVLPVTGGEGAIYFYVAAAALLGVALILLVRKNRSAKRA